ncbi:hypothetical protein B0I37DRAFT_446506 [Chaetomium sp. MPI-CAGE-AT-0009]|nr:hypothetical protein B0I37DRAFT_446506 [Chaetomium sp. MPI-CAGE-AT-0009]
MSAAARAEYRTVSPETEAEADNIEFVVSDTDGSDDTPPSRRRGRKKRKGKGPIRVGDTPAGLGASVDRFTRDLPRIAKETHCWITDNLPTISGLPEVKQMLPRIPFGPRWTDEDGATVDRDWRKHPQRTQLLRVAGNKELLTLYKCSLRLMRCLPEDIISCRFNLEYDLNQNRALARGQRPFWSGSFCKSLAALFVHPMWRGSVAPLVAAIQYTIIVENNDSGPWVMEVPGCDRFLSRLLNRKRQQPATKAPELRRQLHAEMTVTQPDEFGREIGIDRSRWDVLFQAQSHRLLSNALDSMAHMGFPVFMPLELYNRGISGRRSPKDYPQAQDLAALREYSLVCERERLAYKAKLPADTPGTQDDPAPENLPEPHEEPNNPEPQGPIQDPKRQRSSQAEPLSPNHPRKRPRPESPAETPTGTGRSQSGSQLWHESPGHSQNHSRADTAPPFDRGINEDPVLVGQSLENGEGEDVGQGEGNVEEEGEGDHGDMALQEKASGSRWYGFHADVEDDLPGRSRNAGGLGRPSPTGGAV